MLSKTIENSSPRLRKTTDKLLGVLGAHPYLSALFMCFLITLFCFGSLMHIPSYTPYAAWAALTAVSCGVIYKVCGRLKLPFITFVFLTISAAAFFFLGFCAYRESDRKIVWIYFYGCSLVSLLFVLFYRSELKRRCISLLITGLGFWLKLCYVLCTNVNMRQHDDGWFSDGEPASGHLGYISYLFTYHKLYQDDYRSLMQYCHPPLHHTICAIWLHIMEDIFHVERDAALESMQMLTLFYSFSIIISAYLIFRHFKLEGRALYIPLTLVSFHPCFIYLSALINNDALAWAFTMGAFLCTLKWYKEPSMKNIIKIAFCIGLGMMSKLSAALIAIPVAQIFLIVFLRDLKGSWKKLMGQFLAFGSICVPLGMWFPVRGLIRWGIPLTYVQELPAGMDQEISDISFLNRVTDFRLSQVSNVFENWAYRDEYGELAGVNEHNPLIAILKNSVFGEFINGMYFESGMVNVCRIFFWTSASIAFIAFVSMIITFINDRSADKVQKLFTGMFYIVLVGNLYSMSSNYPLVCTMNFRYLMPTVVIGALFVGMVIKRKSKLQRPYSIAMTVAVPCFAAMSSLIYIVVCQKSDLG